MKKDIVIVGAGPAGLCAAIEAGKTGASVLVMDLNLKAGGQLFKQIHKFFGSSAHRSGTRGFHIGQELVEETKKYDVEIWLQSTVFGIFKPNQVAVERCLSDGTKQVVTVEAKKIIIAAGASENAVRFKGWTKPGVMGAGAAQTMVNVNHVKPGQKIVMLGSGNVGLIVSYQLMQAGCEVTALVEAAPKIGGYAVHAAKIRRAGVPIYTRHTIVEAIDGEDGCVKEVVIAQVDENFQVIEGTEKKIEADCVTLAAGLKPSVELPKVLDCAFTFRREFGGFIPLHDEKMETSVAGIYVAGDVTGVEEASTAMEEGRIAGISAAESLQYMTKEDAAEKRQQFWERIGSLRMGPFGEVRQKAKESVIKEFHEKVKGGEA